MRALAEFIMRSRLQAALIAMLGLPFISEAAIALVTLRKGSNEGLLLVAIALIPGVLIIMSGHGSVDIVVNALLVLLAIYLPALILRVMGSWSYTVWGLLGFVVVVLLVTSSLVPELLEQLQERYQQFMTSMSQEVQGFQAPEATQVLIAGMLAFGLATYSLLGLMLGRWWQATLYNPGGFGAEFRQFRLGPIASTLCVMLLLACLTQTEDFVFWTSLFALPLILVAIAIVHGVVKAKQLNKLWLFAFYGVMIVLKPVLLLAAIGFLDAWLNFRNRLSLTE